MKDRNAENRVGPVAAGWSGLARRVATALGFGKPAERSEVAPPPTAPVPIRPLPLPLPPGRTELPIEDPSGTRIASITLEREGDRVTVERSTFINAFGMEVDLPTAERLATAATRQNWAELDRFHPEFLPWYCRQCEQNYAAGEWLVVPVFDDDAPWWLDCYRGRCPQGHSRMIAD
jgi:hypothetical protein